MVALSLLLLGCAQGRPDVADWDAETRQTLRTVESELATMALVLEQDGADRLPGGYAVVAAVSAEEGASTASSRLSALQPPVAREEEYAAVTDLLDRADAVLARARIVVTRGDRAEYSALVRRLDRVVRASADLRERLP